MKQQSALMKFDPATGVDQPYPSHAAQWRDWHGHSTAWLFNPWTGDRRDAQNVGSDTVGDLIVPPGEPIYLARSLSDDLMDCVDRLGSEASTVDHRVWDHLLVYAPKEKLAAETGQVFASPPESDVSDEMVARFLAWKLPHDFSPDCHIRFDREAAGACSWPVGTNLLTSSQARDMLKHVMDVAPGPLDFGNAISAMKAGKRVARSGWNGKGMWLFLIQGSNDIAKLHGYGFGEMMGEPTFRDAIFMKTVDNQLVPWTASQTDMLADDWQIVE